MVPGKRLDAEEDLKPDRIYVPPRIMAKMRLIASTYEIPLELLRVRGYGHNSKERVACRGHIAAALRAEGISLATIGTYLNLHHTTVLYLIKEHIPVRAKQLEIPCPDLSGEWAI